MKNTANKVWAKIKNINVNVTGKIKLGFIEITVASLIVHRLLCGPVFLCKEGGVSEIGGRPC